MTKDNRRRNLSDELTRASQALAAAEALIPLGLFADSVSRAYYAALHLVRALLLTRGIEARSHRGVIHLLNVELIRPGHLDSSHNRLVASLQRMRENADYDAGILFTEADARSAVADVKALDADARALIAREGGLS